MTNPATSVLGVGRDLGRLVRERPALVVGGGALALIGVAVLNRKPGDEATAPVDPAAGLFPGVSTYGGDVPGSGSVPFGGYPSAGDGSVADLPADGGWFDVPLPSWGLSCNGQPKPEIAGLPGTWTCTDAGWQYVPPLTSTLPSAPAPSPTPSPTPTTTEPAPTRPTGPKPSGVAGWVYLNGTYTGWRGSYDSKTGVITVSSAYSNTYTRKSYWVSGQMSVTVGGQRIAVRRLVNPDGTWSPIYLRASQLTVRS